MACKENIYFLRSFLLLIEGGLYISKEILSRECQKSDNDLDELLKIYEPKLKHLFHDKQYQKLFPKFGTADVNCWDLQLLVGVLITVFGRDLKSGEKDKLKLLRYMRNETFMHCTTAALDESKYEEVIEELDDNITTLASTFDISVQQRCSNYIKQFTTGPLDAVRPSLPTTLNGFSQLCQKKFKVGVETELVIGGPSSTWTNLCEHTLETIFNHAESMASEDGGFQDIEENVKRMLSYLESNIDVIFKGCKRKCIILYFECNDYESFLSFLDKVECQEYARYLNDLSKSLHRFFKPRNPISITSKVTSESLQLVLIDIIKTLSNEEEEQQHVVEISSEENIHENKAMAMTSRDVHKETKLIKQSGTSLLLNFELQSEEALPQMLQTFKGTPFSDSLTKVAGSLSRYCGSEITLKASMNVGAVLEALEESVFDKDALDKESESIYAKTSKEDEITLSVNDDMTSERIYTITSKEADLQSLQGTEEEREASSVTDKKKQEVGYTRNSETESECSEFDFPVSISKAVQTECDILQKDTVSPSKAVQTEPDILQKDTGTENYSKIMLTLMKVGTKLTRRLMEKRVKDLSNNCGEDIDELLLKNKSLILQQNFGKQNRSVFFPQSGHTNLDSWDLCMFCFILVETCDLTYILKRYIKKLLKIRNKLCHLNDPTLETRKFDKYTEQMKCSFEYCLKEINDENFTEEMNALVQSLATGPLSVDDTLKAAHKLYGLERTNREVLEKTGNGQDLTNRQLDTLIEKHERLDSRLPSGASVDIPGIGLVLEVENCSAEKKKEVFDILEKNFNDAIEQNVSSLEEDLPKGALQTLRETATHVFREFLKMGRHIESVQRKCLMLTIKCASVKSFVKMISDYRTGDLSLQLSSMEMAIKNLQGCGNVQLEYLIFKEEFMEVMDDLVSKLYERVQHTEYTAVRTRSNAEHSIRETFKNPTNSDRETVQKRFETKMFVGEMKRIETELRRKLNVENMSLTIKLVRDDAVSNFAQQRDTSVVDGNAKVEEETQTRQPRIRAALSEEILFNKFTNIFQGPVVRAIPHSSIAQQSDTSVGDENTTVEEETQTRQARIKAGLCEEEDIFIPSLRKDSHPVVINKHQFIYQGPVVKARGKASQISFDDTKGDMQIIKDFDNEVHRTVLQGDSFHFFKEVFQEYPEEHNDESNEHMNKLKRKWVQLEQMLLVNSDRFGIRF